MNPEIFAEWMRRRGHRILKSDSTWWHQQGPLTYQAFPYHWIITPPEQEIQELMLRRNILALRYSTPVTNPVGYISYHAVYEQNSYDLGQLSKWSRKNIRNGLKQCLVEQISFDYLAKEGFALQVDTLKRQKRSIGASQKWWSELTLGAMDLPGFRAWGAFVDGKLAASVITFQMVETIYLLYQQCHRKYLNLHVNNALGYMVTKNVLQIEGVRGILYGLHSLDAPASVDEFKFRMGYTSKSVRQRVTFHPIANPLMRPVTHQIVKSMSHLFPESSVIAKFEGMLRFYLDGKLPREAQAQRAILQVQVSEEVSTSSLNDPENA